MSEMLYPIGIQDFGSLRRGGYVYVDKTRHIHELARTGKYYFLSRPRRFGKSLLISTMEAYFKGERELFSGLAMEQLEKDWVEYPVLHIDLNTGKFTDPDSLKSLLNDTLCKWEDVYGSSPSETTLGLRFSGIVERACRKTGRQVVILVDEYDKPLLQTLDNEELQEDHRMTLKSFYSVLKSQDRYIKFAFLTGVTKFSKVSVFSDLNNLRDISLNAKYAHICGITEDEIHSYFKESVNEFAQANGWNREQALAKLKEQYDGYRFSIKAAGVYNPFSLLNALSDKELGNYWFETGTPTFLVKLLKESDYDLRRLVEGEEQSASMLGDITVMRTNPVPVIYQSGYLTIKGMNEFGDYTLGFPNKEVATGFIRYLLPFYLPKGGGESNFAISNFVRDVRRGDPESFMARLQALFADNNFRIAGKMEKYFHNALYLVFTMMGFNAEVEKATSQGCIDAVVKTTGYIYVIECKLDKGAQAALDQINERGYATPYAVDPRKLYKIGVSFSSATRGITEYVIE